MNDQPIQGAPPTVEAPLPVRRPGWPKVIGIISLIYAIGGLLLTTCFSAQVYVAEYFFGLQGIDLETPTMIKMTAGIGWILALGLGILMLLGAIGVLRRRRAGISRLRTWAILRIVLLLISLALTVLTAPTQIQFQIAVQDAQMELMRDQGIDVPDIEKTEEQIWTQTLIIISIMTALTAAYPAFLGLFLSRRAINDDIQEWD
jgi:hypothetical protein